MSIRSLIVKVGANAEELDKALARVGTSVKRTDTDLKKLGQQPIGEPARKSLDALEKTISGITAAQQKQADRARLAAVGLEQIGGAARLTKSELDQVNRTLQTGLDAYRALGQQAPKDLQKVASAVTAQKSALDGAKSSTTSMLSAVAPLTTALAGAFTVGKVAAFAREVVDLGGHLTDMRDKTGISVEGLQQLEAAAKLSGNTLDQVTGAVSQMQNRLASGDTSAVGAVQELGLSLSALRSQAPDEQFRAIARGIADIQDPAERTRVAMDLFGRSGADLLPTLVSDIDAVANATTVMSTETAEALDRAGDAWDTFIQQVKVAGATVLGQVIQAPEDPQRPRRLAFVDEADVRLVDRLAGNTGNLATALDLANIHAQSVAQTLDGFVTKTGVGQPLSVPGLPSPAVIEASDRALNKLAKANDENRKKADEAARAAELMLRTMASTEKALTNLFSLSESVRGLGQNWSDLRDTQSPIKVGFDEFDTVLKKLGNTTIPTLEQEAARLGLTLGDYGPTLDQLGVKTQHASGALDELSRAFVQMAQVSGGAFGGVVQEIANVFTSLNLATKAATAYGDATTKAGKAAALVAGVAAVGQATGSGSTLGRVVGGASTGAQLGGAVGGPLGAGIGAVAGGAVGLARGLFDRGREAREVNDLRDAFQRTFGEGERGFERLNIAANRAGLTINRLLNARTVDQYTAAVNELNEAFQFQDQAMQTLDDAVQRYGFSINELGPAFQRQQLDQQAQTLFQDYKVLTAAGIEHGVVLGKMSEGVNEYVKNARRFGTEVPASMKPMLQEMVKLGLLTDDSGQAFSSLEEAGITFSETMSEGFTRVVEEVKNLTDAIARGLGIALDNLPSRVPVNIDIQYNDPGFAPLVPDQAATGGIVTPRGIQHFATGGRVLPFLRRGTDTVPAMLTPGEIVLNAAQQRAVAASMGGGGGSIVVNVSVNGYIDSPAAQRNLARIVQAQLTKAVQDRKKVGMA